MGRRNPQLIKESIMTDEKVGLKIPNSFGSFIQYLSLH